MSEPEFFRSAGPFSVAKIAKDIGATLREGDDPNREISCTGPIESAGKGAISFLDNIKYASHLESTKASAVICKSNFANDAPEELSILIHDNPYSAYANALAKLYPTSLRPQSITGENGVSAAAFVSPGATFEDDVVIEAGAVIGRDCSIGKGSRILAGTVLGAQVQIGRNSTIGPRASISNAMVGDNVIVHSGVSIGQDGFGYSMGPQGHKKIPQIGRVIIQSDVEIGANTAIDRGANRDTIIGEGTKIDNLVQIGHNVVIGRHCILVGMAGIAGSATLGDFVVLAGRASIAGHVRIGDNAQVGGGSGVYKNVEAGQKVMGHPAIPAKNWMRNAARIAQEVRKENKRGKK